MINQDGLVPRLRTRYHIERLIAECCEEREWRKTIQVVDIACILVLILNRDGLITGGAAVATGIKRSSGFQSYTCRTMFYAIGLLRLSYGSECAHYYDRGK